MAAFRATNRSQILRDGSERKALVVLHHAILIAMRIVIHSHARIRGLGDKQILAAYETGSKGRRIRRRDAGADPPRWAMIGFDQQARQIELVAVQGVGDSVIVIHANYLTKGFLTQIERSGK